MAQWVVPILIVDEWPNLICTKYPNIACSAVNQRLYKFIFGQCIWLYMYNLLYMYMALYFRLTCLWICHLIFFVMFLQNIWFQGIQKNWQIFKIVTFHCGQWHLCRIYICLCRRFPCVPRRRTGYVVRIAYVENRFFSGNRQTSRPVPAANS